MLLIQLNMLSNEWFNGYVLNVWLNLNVKKHLFEEQLTGRGNMLVVTIWTIYLCYAHSVFNVIPKRIKTVSSRIDIRCFT